MGSLALRQTHRDPLLLQLFQVGLNERQQVVSYGLAVERGSRPRTGFVRTVRLVQLQGAGHDLVLLSSSPWVPT